MCFLEGGWGAACLRVQAGMPDMTALSLRSQGAVAWVARGRQGAVAGRCLPARWRLHGRRPLDAAAQRPPAGAGWCAWLRPASVSRLPSTPPASTNAGAGDE